MNSLKISALSVNSIHQLEKKMNNDHLVLSDNLKSNKINVNLSVLIDINIINYSFIDDSFMQKHSLLCFSLFEICILQKFDDQSVVFNSITHYALVKLWVSSEEFEKTLFYVTQLSQFSVVLDLSWLKSHKTIINLCHNQLIFEFQVNSELILETLLNILISTVSISVSSTFLLLKHLKIYVINSASFLQLARKKNHDLFIIFMRNINKALKITSFVDSVTLLSLEYHNFLNVFSCKLMNILSEWCLYDHKIQLQKSKTSIFESLYDMFQNELWILKKYLKNNLIKDFI